MKICWFNEHRLGLVANDRVYDVTAALDALPAPAYPRSMGDHVIAHLSALRAEIERLQPASAWLPLDSVRWLSPVGPVQADVAYGVDTKKYRLHLRLGFSF